MMTMRNRYIECFLENYRFNLEKIYLTKFCKLFNIHCLLRFLYSNLNKTLNVFTQKWKEKTALSSEDIFFLNLRRIKGEKWKMSTTLSGALLF